MHSVYPYENKFIVTCLLCHLQINGWSHFFTISNMGNTHYLVYMTKQLLMIFVSNIRIYFAQAYNDRRWYFVFMNNFVSCFEKRLFITEFVRKWHNYKNLLWLNCQITRSLLIKCKFKYVFNTWTIEHPSSFWNQIFKKIVFLTLFSNFKYNCWKCWYRYLEIMWIMRETYSYACS